jgi:rhamnosyltransferase
VRYLSCGHNLGIAAALNRTLAQVARDGFRAALLCDQDSHLGQDVLPAVLDALNAAGAERVAMMGSNSTLPGSGKYSAGWADDRPGAFRKTDVVVFSGSLVLLESFGAVGPFREEFFMDAVDIEWCWRAKRLGYSILQALKPTMQHGAGNPRRHRVLGREFWVINHQPYRYYFMARNGIALLREYPDETSPLDYLATLGRSLAFEPNRVRKLRFVLRGMVDGLRGRFDSPPL